jgi:hypothetical protein
LFDINLGLVWSMKMFSVFISLFVLNFKTVLCFDSVSCYTNNGQNVDCAKNVEKETCIVTPCNQSLES